ncbi:hypothetical protein KFE25_009046 [Diacronema lutheri]|uniref:DUF6787 domain-containing protein n=1 Tax=Diacronema lutheri TaxID=2081491 RepID=A0A8J5XZ50_DIALT|nr:hypothetical protein KFE25_009046 [Diacronema lutheri]
MAMRSFWLWTTKRRPTWRESRTEAAVAFAVFGATGSTSLAVVRPALKAAGFEGSLWEGPNSYRAASVLIVSPCYACTLVTMGTLAGRHRFFANMCSRILGRFVPFAGRILCPPARAALRAEAKS